MNRYSDINNAKNTSKNIRSIPITYKVTNTYPSIPLSENDIYVITEFGDRLDLLADQFYGDVSYYWIISISNPQSIDFGSLYLKPNLQLRIPQNIDNIKTQYKIINQL